MEPVEGVNRVTMKQKDSYILYVKDPEVFTSPQNPNSFIIFGELTFEDHEKKLTQEAIENLKKEGEKLRTVTEKKEEPKVEVVPEGEELSEEGLEKEAIETVMNEGKCSRQVAIRALRAHNGDPVEALLEEEAKSVKKEDLNKVDIDKDDHEIAIDVVAKEGHCSREDAIKALENHNWDPVEA